MIKIEVEHRDRIRPCRWALEIDGAWTEGYWHGFWKYEEIGNRDTIAAILEDESGITKAYDLRFLFLQFTDKPNLDAGEKQDGRRQEPDKANVEGSNNNPR